MVLLFCQISNDIDRRKMTDPTPEQMRVIKDPTVEFKPVIEFLPTTAQGLSEAWHSLRGDCVTASNAGPCIGMSPFNTAEDKLHQMQNDPTFKIEANKAMREGSQEEWFAMYTFHRHTRALVYESPYRICEQDPFLAATPDLLARFPRPIFNDYGRIVIGECKMPEHLMYDYPPIYYVVQQFMQMNAYGLRQNFLICVSKLNGNMRMWRIAWTDEFWDFIYKRLQFFWTCVTRGVPSTGANLPNIYHCLADVYKDQVKFLTEYANKEQIPICMIPDSVVNDRARHEALIEKHRAYRGLPRTALPPPYIYSIRQYDQDEKTTDRRRERYMISKVCPEAGRLDVRFGLNCTKIRKLLVEQYHHLPHHIKLAINIVLVCHHSKTLESNNIGSCITSLSYESLMFLVDSLRHAGTTDRLYI